MFGTSTESANTVGKPAPLGAGATQNPSPIGDTKPAAQAATPKAQGKPGKDVFAIAGQIERLLQGCSNKEALKILSAVGSQHNLRTISMDRPITGSAIAAPKGEPVKTGQGKKKGPKKGPTPPAAWKQTDEYHHLSGLHKERVSILKSLDPTNAAAIATATGLLRETEQKLKDLKPKSSAGDQ